MVVLMDKTAVALGGFSALGIVAVAFSPTDPETKALAFAALGPLGGAAGGMVMPHIASGSSRRISRMPAPTQNSPEFS